MAPVPLSAILWLPCAYLLGAIPTSYLVARAMRGVDLREFGSRNLGATNLYRLVGWGGAIPAALFDVAKGAGPVLLWLGLGRSPAWWALVVGCAAVLGHVFSPFVRFRGGKGVATAAGVFLAYVPLAIAADALVWIGLVAATGYVSVGSVAAAVAFPVLVAVLYPSRPEGLWAAVAVALFVIFNHRSNLRRLIAGTESRFGGRGKVGS
ncbi:MAG TPA: glycerol-3-phosphate 1-O-acyltransferase PlsY [Gemmatimonadales bacterium]|nr:glycerol-3-phosphate 1-O-acyltransferase PlsY [Gemmatimonadales bacterium]